MKQLVSFVLVLALASVASAQLSGTSFTHGGMTHHNFSDGTSGVSFDHGGMSHHTLRGAGSVTHGTSFQHGGMTHFNFTPVTGTNDAIVGLQRNQQMLQQQQLAQQQFLQQQILQQQRLSGMSANNKRTSDMLRANADRRRAAKGK